ncbi:LL-diaminopimelate aminotransferase [Robertmurraya massiliosenegalensis]|uniref:LL-diaminopimelate aminotransferase n=1 Tax=Robertmurraya TaxID=2837507 RepID=UPI0039A5EE2F
MDIHSASRMQAFQENIFTELTNVKNAKAAQGIEIIDLSIGSPDLAPPEFVLDILSNTTKNPNKYGYAIKGTEEFHQAIKNYYIRNYYVDLDSDHEVLSLMGSQDGIVHLPMVLCDPGDYILVPDPGYTAYSTGVSMAGATIYPMPLKKENGYLPNFEEIPPEVCEKARLMIINFPGNPIPVVATEAFFTESIAFAKRHNIVILHDFAYSELYYDKKPLSFLSFEGAKDVGIEMNSLSKSFNMAGCRVAYAVGNREVIKLLRMLKSNLDYGVFLPIQAAATRALEDTSEFLQENRSIYQNRRDILIEGFKKIGWNVKSPEASMFIWAEVPPGFTSKEFTFTLMEKAKVVVTPGNAFGIWGEGYVRIALVQKDEILRKALQQIEKSGLFHSVREG